MNKIQKEKLAENYNADSIVTLNGLEAVRKRPGMYLGASPQSVDGKMSGAQLQMAQEILSNAIDEAQDGFGDKILITIHPDNAMTIQDFGRGLPKGDNFEAAIRQLTKLHTSGKIESKSYVNSGGMNGVGLKGTNALSSYVDVNVVTSQHEHYHLRVQQEKILVKEDLPYDESMHTGTKVTFHPDDTYFDTIEWNDGELEHRIEQSAFLVPKVHFIFTDERKPYQGDDDDVHEHYYIDYYKEHGLSDYVQHLTESSELIAGMPDPIPFHGTYKPRGHKDEVIEVDGALLYTTAEEPEMHTFVNSIPTMADGPHVTGAKQGIFRVFKDYAQNHNMLKGKETIKSSDAQSGLVLALSLKVPEDLLMFGDQAKTKFTTTQSKPAVQHVIESEVSVWLADHPNVAKSIVNSIKDARQVREATKKMRKATQAARKAKKGNGRLFVSSKLKPASAKDPSQKEIYIVEGDSACVSYDTKIQLVDGSIKTIEQLTHDYELGKTNYVWSKDETTNWMLEKPIDWAGVTRHQAQLFKLVLSNGTEIKATGDHRIMLTDGSYKQVANLGIGDHVAVTTDDWTRAIDDHVVVDHIEKLVDLQDVYDLTILDTHNFALANHVIVHNCGGLLKGRNPKTQGLFPIRGKILNVQDLKLPRVIKNQEISTITSVLGAGISKDFDPASMEYDKVIIASDADADGFAIRALLITLFYNYFPGLIEQGHLYYVNAPLFKITHYEHGDQVNDFAYDAQERDKMVAAVEKKFKNAHPQVSRFKGLGEMSTDETKRTLLDPKHRYLTRVTVGNVQEAKDALKLMMGKDPSGRKDYMENKVDYNAEDVG